MVYKNNGKNFCIPTVVTITYSLPKFLGEKASCICQTALGIAYRYAYVFSTFGKLEVCTRQHLAIARVQTLGIFTSYIHEYMGDLGAFDMHRISVDGNLPKGRAHRGVHLATLHSREYTVISEFLRHYHCEGAEGVEHRMPLGEFVMIIVRAVAENTVTAREELIVKSSGIFEVVHKIRAEVAHLQAENTLVGQNPRLALHRPIWVIVGDYIAVFVCCADVFVDILGAILAHSLGANTQDAVKGVVTP